MIIMIQTLQRWTEYFTCNRYSVSSLWINQWQCHCFIELQCLHSWFSIWIHIEKNRTGVSWSCVSTWLVIRVKRVFFTFIVVPILCEITDFLHKTFVKTWPYSIVYWNPFQFIEMMPFRKFLLIVILLPSRISYWLYL